MAPMYIEICQNHRKIGNNYGIGCTVRLGLRLGLGVGNMVKPIRLWQCGYVYGGIRPTYGATYRMSFRLPVLKTKPEP